jgi:Cys-rich protein (TIGR01571 family)
LINLSPLLIVSHLISCLHHQSSYQFPQIQMTINMNESASVAYTAVSLDEHVSVTTPVTRSVRVQVAAPMDMAAGFKFVAAYKGKRFSVTVPPGGAIKNQKIEFSVPVDEEPAVAINSVGHWKDGLFGCFNHGVCSSHLWCAWCCRACAVGLVMQRLGLNWLGHPVAAHQAKKTFHTVLCLATSYMILSYLISIMDTTAVLNEDNEAHLWISSIQFVASFLVWAWSVWTLTATRAFVRAKYQIPEGQFHGCEDLCCALFCSCCTIAQISRHTEGFECNHSESSETGKLQIV